MTSRHLDRDWLQAHPLPVPAGETDKNSKGRVLAIGGSASVPGALALTGEASLRVGAGKVQMATIASAALGLGLLLPETAVIALGERDGELHLADGACAMALGACDTVVAGPGISDGGAAAGVLAALAAADGPTLVLDALLLPAAGDRPELLDALNGPCILTPHLGEMAALLRRDKQQVQEDPEGCATAAATRFGATVVLKGAATTIATPDGTLLRYEGGGPGLATGGSGDVLAGIVGGLLARGADPLTAAGWAVWIHGEAGRRLAAAGTPLGFLARELLPELPRLLAS